jgi:hypothetical protein
MAHVVNGIWRKALKDIEIKGGLVIHKKEAFIFVLDA